MKIVGKNLAIAYTLSQQYELL